MSANLGTIGKLGVDIGFNDKTKPGSRSVEQSASKMVQRTSGGAIRTFGKVEEAASRALGGSSLTSGLTRRLSAAREVASGLGSGLAEASASGNVLTGTMSALGVVGGATVGVLAAAAFGAFKLADGWAKGAASIGRTAETIGVATKQLQEFTAAAERVGVDRGTATGTLGSISQTLNDARYGRNNDAVALLGRLGVKLQLNKDGTVDVGSMLPALAEAIARQNSSGRRTAAHILGISDTALPAFAQGGKALSASMSDADKTSYMVSDDDTRAGRRIVSKETTASQLKDIPLGLAGRAAALGGEGALDAVVNGGSALASGSPFGTVVKQTFAPAASMIERGGRAIERAATKLVTASGLAGAAAKNNNALNMRPIGGGGFQHFSTVDDSVRAAASQIKRDQNKHGARNIAELIGGRIGADGKPHWGWAPASDHNDTAAYIRNVSQRTGFDAHQDLNFSDPETLAKLIHAIITQENGRNPYSKDQIRDIVGNGQHSSVKVEVHLPNAPAGTRAKVTVGGSKPAVSMAMAH